MNEQEPIEISTDSARYTMLAKNPYLRGHIKGLLDQLNDLYGTVECSGTVNLSGWYEPVGTRVNLKFDGELSTENRLEVTIFSPTNVGYGNFTYDAEVKMYVEASIWVGPRAIIQEKDEIIEGDEFLEKILTDLAKDSGIKKIRHEKKLKRLRWWHIPKGLDSQLL